jgi:nitrogen fixation protein NifU and related proteins
MEDRQAQIEYLLDHYQHPRNHGEMPDADVHVQGGHEGCADIITMYLKFDGAKVEKVSFTGAGCTVSQASASIMTELAQGKTIAEIEEMDYGALEAEIGHEVITTRPRCATLGMDVLKAAAQKYRNEQRAKNP